MADLLNNSVITSRDISTLTGKVHSSVVRSIRQHSQRYNSFDAEITWSTYRSRRNRTEVQVLLTRTGADWLLLHYKNDFAMAVVERWRDLESTQSIPFDARQEKLRESEMINSMYCMGDLF